MAENVIIASLMRNEGNTGVQTHMKQAMELFEASGMSVSFASPYDYNKAISSVAFATRKIAGAIYSPATVSGLELFHERFLTSALKKKLLGGHKTSIYAQCPFAARAAMKARVSSEQKVVMVVHFNHSQALEWVESGDLKEGSRPFNHVVQNERETMAKVDGLVYVSGYMKAYVEDRYPEVKKVPSIVVPNFCGEPEVPDRDISGDLITIGTLETRKNQQFILHVLAAAKAVGHVYSLNVVGDGPDEGMLVDLAKRLGIEAQVHLLGRVAGGSRFIRNHRAYVHSATMESFGIVLIEALASRIPVLTARVGGCSEIVDDGVQGKYWPLDDSAEAARILISVLEDPGACERMGEAGYERYKERYTPEAAGSLLVPFIRSL